MSFIAVDSLESSSSAGAFSATASSLSSDFEQSTAYRTSVGKTLTCDQLSSSLIFQLGRQALRDCVPQLQGSSQAEAEAEPGLFLSPAASQHQPGSNLSGNTFQRALSGGRS